MMTQKEISATTCTTILEAASKLILEKGVEAFTLEAVAKEAGLSKGGLLYHFPSKRLLIESMINRLTMRVDASLEEELANSGGDFLIAYIKASFKTDPERDRISNALFAAIANEPDLIQPLQNRFARMQTELTMAAASPEIATIIRLAMDGLWVSDLFGFAPPSSEIRVKMMNALLEIAK